MNTPERTRRDFLKAMSAGLSAAAIGASPAKGEAAAPPVAGGNAVLTVNPEPKFPLSPNLYMQFMEPLGTTDGSVAAAWDFGHDRWRSDVVAATKELAPPLMRWGGCFASYYRWKEGVGPRNERRPMLNLLWGGVETNQIGTHEFIDFCRQVGAEPFFCVNFESDGRKHWMTSPKGDTRTAGPEEAAEWVDYCNNHANRLRQTHGVKEPYGLRLWQIGNETSYSREGYDVETAARRTVAFAKAMRKADSSLELIGWGDSGWSGRMIEIAGEQLQYLAFHHMFNPDAGVKDSPLRGIEYRRDPDRTWTHLMNAARVHEARIKQIREETAGSKIPLALTECHFALPGRNRCEVLSTWAAGVANARLLNVHERHGDRLKIATLADFCGTRWQVNAIMIPVPGGDAFMMPVARVMSLYRKHAGQQAVTVTKAPDALDVTASRTGDRLFLHVVNTNRTRAVPTELRVDGMTLASGEVFTLVADSEYEVMDPCPEVLSPQHKELPTNGYWTFPPASVSAVEIVLTSRA